MKKRGHSPFNLTIYVQIHLVAPPLASYTTNRDKW